MKIKWTEMYDSFVGTGWKEITIYGRAETPDEHQTLLDSIAFETNKMGINNQKIVEIKRMTHLEGIRYRYYFIDSTVAKGEVKNAEDSRTEHK